MGRFHEKLVGPHPCWSYQIAFPPAEFTEIMTWLALNHGALDVFAHPNTGDCCATTATARSGWAAAMRSTCGRWAADLQPARRRQACM